MKNVQNKKTYFLSDLHLGSPNKNLSLRREKKIIHFLNEIKDNAKSIYFVGDIFDFWFEYKQVVPKGHVRFLGKIAELVDNNIDIHFISGNHDLWMKNYFESEIGVKIHHNNIIVVEKNIKIFISHGDGIIKGDLIYKMIKFIFKSKFCQKLFRYIHPDLGISLAFFWSRKSRKKNDSKKNNINLNENILEFCKINNKVEKVNYYIFGHYHYPTKLKIDKDCVYFNLGDWINHFSYAVLENGDIKLKYFKN